MFGGRDRDRRLATLEQEVAAMAADLRRLSVEAEQARARAMMTDALGDRVSALGEQLALHAERFAVMPGDLSHVRERLEAWERDSAGGGGIADFVERLSTIEAAANDRDRELAEFRLVLQRFDHQLAFQRDDNARMVAGLMTRLERGHLDNPSTLLA